MCARAYMCAVGRIRTTRRSRPCWRSSCSWRSRTTPSGRRRLSRSTTSTSWTSSGSRSLSSSCPTRKRNGESLGLDWGFCGVGGGGVESGREGWRLDGTFIVGGWPTGAWWNIIVEGCVCVNGKGGALIGCSLGEGGEVWWGWGHGGRFFLEGLWWQRVGLGECAGCTVGWGGEGGRRACSVERWGWRWIECWPGLSPLSRLDNTCSTVCRVYRKEASSVWKSWHQV